jgi:peptidyl-prolyl cis-trans isomerase SurA
MVRERAATAQAPKTLAPEPTPTQAAPGEADVKGGTPEAGWEIVDRVVAVVNQDVITLSELMDAVAFYLYEKKEHVEQAQERVLQAKFLDRMIESRLQVQEAEKEKIVVEEIEVKEQLGEVMKRVNATTLEDLEKVIAAQGLTMEGVRKRLREQIMAQRVIHRRVGLRVSVTDQEIERYFLENREKLETGLTFQARHILLAPPSNATEASWEATRLKAEEVWARVRAGEDFSELARTYSQDPSAKDGGDLGTMKQGELAPEIESTILRLRPGEAGGPIRTKLGYHIFKLEWKESLTGGALGQAKQQIRDILYSEKYQARLEVWLGELRKKAIIDIRL